MRASNQPNPEITRTLFEGAVSKNTANLEAALEEARTVNASVALGEAAQAAKARAAASQGAAQPSNGQGSGGSGMDVVGAVYQGTLNLATFCAAAQGICNGLAFFGLVC